MSRLNLIFLIAFIGLLIWITLFQPETVGTIQRGAMSAMRPFLKASDRLETSLDQLGDEAPSPAQLRERLAGAEQERDRLKLEVIQLDELLQENRQLRRALQYRERSPLSLAAARVISRKPSQWYSTVVIDKGESDGIAADSPVVVPLGDGAGLVGKVSEVLGPRSAVVVLLTDELCQVSAKLENSHEQGILSGQRGALLTLPSLKLRYLSKEARAEPGTKVLSSGTGELFPPNLLLGEVAILRHGAIDAEAVVKPAVNFDDLVDVFVILPAAADEEEDADGEAPDKAGDGTAATRAKPPATRP